MADAGQEEKLYSTGDLARLTGNTLRTVRYYESMGLLHPSPRAEGAHRLFSESELARLRTISDLRAVGISLEDVTRVLDAREPVGARQANLARLREVLDQQLATVRDHAARLARVEEEILAARAIIERCSTCVDKAVPGPCGQCDNFKAALPNPWVRTLLAPEEAAKT